MLKEKLAYVLNNFLPNRLLSDSQRTIFKRYLINDFSKEISRLIDNDLFEISVHTAVGRPADIPWVGIHYRKDGFDSSSQTGVYVAILFKVLGDGVAFTLQQGTDKLSSIGSIKEKVRPISNTIRLPSLDFKTTPLSLRPLPFDKTVFPNDPRTSIQIFTNSSRPAKYEAANILGKEYDMEYIQNSDLEGDLTSLVRVYNEWVNSILTSDLEDRYQESISGSSNENNEIKHEETVPPDRLNRLQVRSGSLHPPRNRKEGDLAIKLADFLCEMDSDHRTFNLSGGKQFMEKHHLIPMEQYFNFEKSVDHYLNIYSLCPTCHRKIHYGEKEDRKEMLEILYGMRKTNYQEIYGIQLNDLFRYYNV